MQLDMLRKNNQNLAGYEKSEPKQVCLSRLETIAFNATRGQHKAALASAQQRCHACTRNLDFTNICFYFVIVKSKRDKLRDLEGVLTFLALRRSALHSAWPTPAQHGDSETTTP